MCAHVFLMCSALCCERVTKAKGKKRISPGEMFLFHIHLQEQETQMSQGFRQQGSFVYVCVCLCERDRVSYVFNPCLQWWVN